MKRARQFRYLYDEIYKCNLCIGAPGCQIQQDPERVRRRFIPKLLSSELFVVGMALGARTQRRSGVPYVLPNGSLSRAGRRLDDFLGSFGYSIDPRTARQYAYSSDLIQHYPGAANGGDRQPTRTERDNCSAWLRHELGLVHPKVVVLLGKVAARDFLSRYTTRPKRRDVAIPWGTPRECVIDGHPVVAVAIPHVSYVSHRRHVARIYVKASRHIRRLLADDPNC